MVKTITITEDAYERLKTLKEKWKVSFSEVILKITGDNSRFLNVVKKYAGKIKFDIKKIKEARKLWERELY